MTYTLFGDPDKEVKPFFPKSVAKVLFPAFSGNTYPFCDWPLASPVRIFWAQSRYLRMYFSYPRSVGV